MKAYATECAAYTLTHVVSFYETDAAGYVHFSHYLKWMEEAEHAFLRDRDIPVFDILEGETCGWPRVNVQVSYQKPVMYGDTVVVNLFVDQLLEHGITCKYEMLTNNDIVATGSMTSLYAVLGKGAKPLPDAYKKQLVL